MLKSSNIIRTFSSLVYHCPNNNQFIKVTSLKSCVRNMSSGSNIPLVDIDPTGVFKYILLNVYDKKKDEAKPQMVILRGYKRSDYHSDIFDEVQAKLSPFDCEPLGGGRISHDPDSKKIHIYGYSQGYGKADHEVAAKLVKDAYPGYTITISDEGY
ncbi:14 kDa phosphohistidine phosphatase-like [Maniola hyperantus]|uniref:14 kDa phosphohistidine phosphatase-like n=1 Tax=Aphantopus hyperantus TaxID=2795564 RepID=UPI001569F188|nr:14 kDa phosphohistidine phosphatase-like [Maniola hyperantus]XP_034831190.1 14 kDa phosphohistidine phosphatase-like [Maniola hyperantus]